MTNPSLESLLSQLNKSVAVTKTGKFSLKNEARFRECAGLLAEKSALASGAEQAAARWLIWEGALALGIMPASINGLYMARGRGETPTNFTVPAMNLRAMTFDSARAVFRAANKIDAGAIIFEIARSEMGYTNQRPAEYASSVLAAAIAEGWSSPVCIQGDHFQFSAKKMKADPDGETQALRELTAEAIAAGFYNIDIDSSTLVDLSRPTIPDQQGVNAARCAEMTALIRGLQPKGVEISVGGEIGEVGGKNSTEEELRAFMDGYRNHLLDQKVDGKRKRSGGMTGLSKISIQTGTSHGGVVLPDGTMAQVAVDFDTLKRLSFVAQKEYGMAGAVQHGASTLPENAFGKFPEFGACEVHLATNFQNMLYDRLPADLRDEIYAWLKTNADDERKPSDSDEQFFYKTRKKAIGPFKAQMWGLSAEKREELG
ncbi:MAG: class II fructose-bisphosphate aldolase, partial [Chloroflexi bacterium]|nr:class II fructose-bisphosphate aldolase [Chloroflexota bacterium]